MARLEELTPGVDRVVMDTLGDAIAYTVAATGEVLSIKARVNFTGGEVTLQVGSAMIDAPESMTVLMVDLPGEPARNDVITVLRVPGEQWSPANVRRNRHGTQWVMDLEPA